eukprot:scaffold106713_cov26-Prasinocladus_malaysianus.AAC.2
MQNIYIAQHRTARQPDVTENCNFQHETMYDVEWTATLLPGTLVEGPSDLDDDDGWSKEADSHFYLTTNARIRQIAADRMVPDGQASQRDIMLAGVSHSEGSMGSCGVGVLKHVTYRFS